MASDRIVVGLYTTKGEAENASHRVVSEGTAEADVTVQVLRDTTDEAPKSMEPELTTLSLDPFFWFLGDLREDYAAHITNGETAVCVSVASADEAETVAGTLMMFEPKRVDIVEIAEPPIVVVP